MVLPLAGDEPEIIPPYPSVFCVGAAAAIDTADRTFSYSTIWSSGMNHSTWPPMVPPNVYRTDFYNLGSTDSGHGLWRDSGPSWMPNPTLNWHFLYSRTSLASNSDALAALPLLSRGIQAGSGTLFLPTICKQTLHSLGVFGYSFLIIKIWVDGSHYRRVGRI
jgi:hypothetical protein